MSIDGSLQLSQGLDNAWCASVFFMTSISWSVNPHLFPGDGCICYKEHTADGGQCRISLDTKLGSCKVSQCRGKLTIREKGRPRKDIEAEEKAETTRLTRQGKAVQLSPFMDGYHICPR